MTVKVQKSTMAWNIILVLCDILIEGFLVAFRACNPTTKDGGGEEEIDRGVEISYRYRVTC
jgi:hypothetical protein